MDRAGGEEDEGGQVPTSRRYGQLLRSSSSSTDEEGGCSVLGQGAEGDGALQRLAGNGHGRAGDGPHHVGHHGGSHADGAEDLGQSRLDQGEGGARGAGGRGQHGDGGDGEHTRCTFTEPLPIVAGSPPLPLGVIAAAACFFSSSVGSFRWRGCAVRAGGR